MHLSTFLIRCAHFESLLQGARATTMPLPRPTSAAAAALCLCLCLLTFLCLPLWRGSADAEIDATALSLTAPPLPYAYDALEPFVDAGTMRVHRDGHHAAYAAKATAALRGLAADARASGEMRRLAVEALKTNDVRRAVAKAVEPGETADAALRGALRNHGGGHANHVEYFANMRPPPPASQSAGASHEPDDDNSKKKKFMAAVTATFGSLDKLKDEMAKAATGVFGSGWVWLVANDADELSVVTTPNQDRPSPPLRVLVAIDVWEHAYYLKHQNKRDAYVAAFWSVVDWDVAATRFSSSLAGTNLSEEL